MAGAVGLVALAVALVIAVKGLPLIASAVEGRRIEEAVRARDGTRLRRAVAGAAGLAELGRVLRRVPTRELLALGAAVEGAAGEERGAQVLSAIAEAVERRDEALARWERVRERRRPEAAAGVEKGAG
jgi:hypothetical protein